MTLVKHSLENSADRELSNPRQTAIAATSKRCQQNDAAAITLMLSYSANRLASHNPSPTECHSHRIQWQTLP